MTAALPPTRTAKADLSGCAIVFDLDGTLVDTAPDLIAALNHCLAGSGYPQVPAQAVRGMIGQGAKAMIRQGLEQGGAPAGADLVEALFPLFLDYYAANIAARSLPYPGCADMLGELAEAGAILAVCTNKTQRLADLLLSELGLASRFAAIVGADSVPNRKPHGGHILETLRRAGSDARPRRAMVGDSETDEKAALHAGLPFIFCPFGYGPIKPEAPAKRTVLEGWPGFFPVLLSALSD